MFPPIGRGTGRLIFTALPPNTAYHIIVRRAAAAGILPKLAIPPSGPGLGITAYLKSGGLERAARMANHTSTRTTQLYDHRHDI
jgi:hypothetical protein